MQGAAIARETLGARLSFARKSWELQISTALRLRPDAAADIPGSELKFLSNFNAQKIFAIPYPRPIGRL
jgi:hypothetical protein